MFHASMVWPAFVGEQHGSLLQAALGALATIPAQVYQEAIDKIQHEIAIGPLFNPTGYMDGRLFDNANQYTRILRALIELKKHLPDPPTVKTPEAPQEK
jgi:hypothetical protein